MINAYVPHPSLIYLTINILNLNTLYVLLHYLPQLEHLGNVPIFHSLKLFSKFILYEDVYISSTLFSINTIDQNLATKLNYPKKLRVLNLR